MALFAAGLCTRTWAQSIPDAGSLNREIDRSRLPPSPPKTPPAAVELDVTQAKPGGVTVTVTAFRIKGNTLLSDAQVQAVLAPFVGKTLDLAGLQTAAAAVTEAYRHAGWIVSTVLPRQAVEQGVVQLDVVEALLGRVRSAKESSRVPQALLSGLVQGGQQRGQPLNREAVDRGLMLADDLPGVNVAGFLTQGEGERETDVLLRVADEPMAMGDVTVDNAGSRSTGNVRTALNLFVNSPLNQGDLLTGMAIATRGSEFVRAAFTLPLGFQGLRFGVNTSALKYRLIAPEFAALEASGHSQSVGLESSYPLLRSRQRNVYLSVNLDEKTFLNRASGTVQPRYSAESLTLGINGNFFDQLGGGGANTWSLAWIANTLDLGGSPNQAADAIGPRTDGHAQILRYSLGRQQSLGSLINDNFSLYASFSGQWANKNLDSSAKFYLGGVYGVRAYPSNEGSGAEGQLFNLELRARLPWDAVATAFYDWGHVQNNVDSYVGAPALNSYSLKGAGLGLSAGVPGGGVLRAVWSHRLGSNPNPTATGKDQDGTLEKNRFWFGATFTF
ncbi:MAG TPA: ShlB/FhaC/HecB family hemolysin secretion/activation protein [Burkholderiaceae bacterium]|jgi:hemolysin activation/secretion protein